MRTGSAGPSDWPLAIGLPQDPYEHRSQRPILDSRSTSRRVRHGRIQRRRASEGVGDVVVGTTVPTGDSFALSGGAREGGTRFLHEDGLPPRWNGAGVSIDRTGDGRVVPDRSTIVRHDRRCCVMVFIRFP